MGHIVSGKISLCCIKIHTVFADKAQSNTVQDTFSA